MNTMSMAKCTNMGATTRISLNKFSSFTPGFAVPKKHVVRRVPQATMQVKAFKENSQLQDWRVKDMVEVCFYEIKICFDDDEFLFLCNSRAAILMPSYKR